MEGSDLVRSVTCAAPFDWRAEDDAPASGFEMEPQRGAARPLRVAAYDLGMKRNILRRLAAHGCEVRVFPATAPASDLLAVQPDGVFFSNGPGDPAPLDYVVRNAREAIRSDVPVFGICLGHQVLALALGAATYKAQVRPSRREPSGPEPDYRTESRSPRRTTDSRWIRSRCRTTWRSRT